MIPQEDIIAEGTWGNRHIILTNEPALIIRTHSAMYSESLNRVIQMELLSETILQGAEIALLKEILKQDK